MSKLYSSPVLLWLFCIQHNQWLLPHVPPLSQQRNQTSKIEGLLKVGFSQDMTVIYLKT